MSAIGQKRTFDATMPEKLEEFSDALTSLLQEAIACSPTSWNKGRLTIECDGRRIDYRLKNDTSSEKAVVSAELAKLCERYWSLFADHGEPWSEATADFWQESGKWKFDVKFVRPDAQITPPKSRWKFWQ